MTGGVIGYAPCWLFGVLAVAAMLGVAACAASGVLRPVLTGVLCRHAGAGPETRPLLLFGAVAVLAATFRMLGA